MVILNRTCHLPGLAGRLTFTGENARGMAHSNESELFWSLMKRGYTGTCRKMSPRHLHRNDDEFSGFHNVRGNDTRTQLDGWRPVRQESSSEPGTRSNRMDWILVRVAWSTISG